MVTASGSAVVETAGAAVEAAVTDGGAGLLNIVCVPLIFAIVFAVMMIYKHLVKNKNELWTRLIPVWAGLLGVVLAIYAFYKVPDLIVADNLLSAILVGLVTGLSAVGVHQIGKQFSKPIDSDSDGNPTVTEQVNEQPAATIQTTQKVKVPDQTVTVPGETIQVRQSYTKVE